MVPKDRARAIFASLDGASTTEGPKSPEPEKTEPSRTGLPERAAETSESAGDEPAAAPGQTEEQLPENIRKALQEIADPALRKRLSDDHFRLKRWDKLGSRLGMKMPDLEGYIMKAVKMAPSADVLDHISVTARVANQLVSDFNTGTPEAMEKFAAAQFKINPQSFVNYVGFLLGKYDTMYNGLRNIDPPLARTLQSSVDSLADSRVKNLVTNLRRTAEAETKQGRESVLGEVADELERFLGWDKKVAEPEKPSAPDPRDVELAKLKAEREAQTQGRQRAMVNSVYDIAGHRLASDVNDYVTKLTTGYPPKAVEKIKAQIEEALYNDLLTGNKHIRDRAISIHQAGRYDKNHHDRLVNFYIEQGQKLLPLLGESIINEWKETIGPVRTRDAARIEQHEKRRDVGAAGAPPKPKIEPAPSGRDPKKLFDYLDRVAEQ
jgi:hypothetical protein